MYERLNIDWGETVVDPLIGAGTDWLGGQIRTLGTGTGSNTGTRCPNQPSDAEVGAMLSWLPPVQLAMLSAAYRNVHGIELPVHDPGEVGFAAYGGSDCKVTTAAGANYRALFDNAMRDFRATVGDTGDGGLLDTLFPPTIHDPRETVQQQQERQTRTGTSWLIVGAVVLVALFLLMRRA